MKISVIAEQEATIKMLEQEIADLRYGHLELEIKNTEQAETIDRLVAALDRCLRVLDESDGVTQDA